MKKSIFTSTLLAVTVLAGTFASSVTMAIAPGPTVNQNQGIPDGVFNNLTEEVCRSCHNQSPPEGIPVNPMYLPNRHHLKVGTTIPPTSDRPNPDPNGDGTPETEYECLSCHSLTWDDFSMSYQLVQNFRNCLNCHQQTDEATVHHLTTFAANQDCKACHGGLINNPNDGHYIPTYQPSLVTPWPSGKVNGDDTVPANSAGAYAGNCNFCHNTVDGMGGAPGTNNEMSRFGTTVSVYQNVETHHSTGLAIVDPARCSWCHDMTELPLPPPNEKIRACENCHGVSTLHNIVWDSNEDGVVQPGMEPTGYSHTGGQADCWGCHGNNGVILMAPGAGAGIPVLNTLSSSTVTAGVDTAISLAGANFTNYVQNPWTGRFDILVRSTVQLTDAAGNATELVPTSITATDIEVVIPASLAAGNYHIAAKKGPSLSNPMNLGVTPAVGITDATCVGSTGVLTVTGSGFSGYLNASNSGTSVTMNDETGTVVSWTDTEIVVEFTACGSTATVNTINGSETTEVTVE